MPSPQEGCGQKGAFLTSFPPSMEYLLCLEFGFGLPSDMISTPLIPQTQMVILRTGLCALHLRSQVP